MDRDVRNWFYDFHFWKSCWWNQRIIWYKAHGLDLIKKIDVLPNFHEKFYVDKNARNYQRCQIFEKAEYLNLRFLLHLCWANCSDLFHHFTNSFVELYSLIWVKLVLACWWFSSLKVCNSWLYSNLSNIAGYIVLHTSNKYYCCENENLRKTKILLVKIKHLFYVNVKCKFLI